jgi:hypothetical protein
MVEKQLQVTDNLYGVSSEAAKVVAHDMRWQYNETAILRQAPHKLTPPKNIRPVPQGLCSLVKSVSCLVPVWQDVATPKQALHHHIKTGE